MFDGANLGGVEAASDALFLVEPECAAMNMQYLVHPGASFLLGRFDEVSYGKSMT